MGQHYRESALAEEERVKHFAWQRHIQAGMGAELSHAGPSPPGHRYWGHRFLVQWNWTPVDLTDARNWAWHSNLVFNCKCPSRIWGGLISQQENFECFCFQIILEMKSEVRRKRNWRPSARHNTCFSSNQEKACMAFFKKKTQPICWHLGARWRGTHNPLSPENMQGYCTVSMQSLHFIPYSSTKKQLPLARRQKEQADFISGCQRICFSLDVDEMPWDQLPSHCMQLVLLNTSWQSAQGHSLYLNMLEWGKSTAKS